MIKKTIVILANSVKHHQHCVAGKCIETKQWIRPVSSNEGAELSRKQSTYHNPHGDFIVRPMQKIEMYFHSVAPLINQPENYLINEEQWQQKYIIADHELPLYLDCPENIWGRSDRVSYLEITQKHITITQSLYLIQVESLKLYKDEGGRRRANFLYNDIKYDLAVTDPNFDKRVSEGNEGVGILCISLGENFRGSCFKLVATVF
ncbi:hypothetical protein BMR03_14675 [Methylococcaceae bacterium HT2]|nr:hypothetical protein BMR03_14675 [Methylococcaceae bacterium HT2]